MQRQFHQLGVTPDLRGCCNDESVGQFHRPPHARGSAVRDESPSLASLTGSISAASARSARRDRVAESPALSRPSCSSPIVITESATRSGRSAIATPPARNESTYRRPTRPRPRPQVVEGTAVALSSSVRRGSAERPRAHRADAPRTASDAAPMRHDIGESAPSCTVRQWHPGLTASTT